MPIFLLFSFPSPHPDLATQMRYLTGIGDVPDSPQLNRNSRVLSWISESEDMLFEDTGTDTGTATANSEWVMIARQGRCFVGFRFGDKWGYFSHTHKQKMGKKKADLILMPSKMHLF